MGTVLTRQTRGHDAGERVFTGGTRCRTRVWCDMLARDTEGRRCGTIAKVRRYREKNASWLEAPSQPALPAVRILRRGPCDSKSTARGATMAKRDHDKDQDIDQAGERGGDTGPSSKKGDGAGAERGDWRRNHPIHSGPTRGKGTGGTNSKRSGSDSNASQ